MLNKRHATVHYRKLARGADVLPSGRTLSESIREALYRPHANGRRYIDDWATRVTSSPTNDEQKRLANDLDIDDMSVFGVLCVFTMGDMQALIDANTSPGPSAPLASVAISETRAPGNNEYIKGIAYWLVVGDHVYIVQHVAVKTKTFEEYLTWLLRESGIVSGNESIVLQSDFDISQIGGDLGNVKSVEIGGLVPETLTKESQREDARESVSIEVRRRRSVTAKRAPWPVAKKIIDLVLGSFAASEIVKSIPNNAALDVRLDIGYRTAGRRSSDSAFMQKVATAVRDLDDGEVKIRSKEGIIQGNEARLHEIMPFNLMHENSTLLDLADVRNKLLTVHQRFLEDDKIK